MASIISKKKTKYKLSDIKTLGHQLLSSRNHINNLPILLTFISPTCKPSHVLESLITLQSFFTPLGPDLPSSSSKSAGAGDPDPKEDPELIYRAWLRLKFDKFVKLLIDVAVSDQAEETIKELVLDTIMEFVKLGKGGKFRSDIYSGFIHSVVYSAADLKFLLNLLVTKYFSYIDIRYFTYIGLKKEAKGLSDGKTATGNESMELVIDKIHSILSRIPSPENSNKESDMWSGSGDYKEVPKIEEDKQLKTDKNNNSVLTVANISKKMKLKLTKAWNSFLSLPLPLHIYKEVLVNLPHAVIPHLSNHVMLCDFLTKSYDLGAVVSVMALSSLFILMTQHGLEYPNFYEKLYLLLEPSIFMAKHRGKFFELLDSCLKSPLLPAYLAAAFAKKLSRLAISVPPSGALVIIALVHNLLRRHPSINCLVHREDDNEPGNDKDSSSTNQGIDPFNSEERDPMKSKSMRSSLWEIDTLRHHYCPPVSRFVLSLEDDLTVRRKTTEINVKDFTAGSYATIFGDEIRRRVKQVPLAFYKATPTSLFSESDFAGWSFKYEEKNQSEKEAQDHGNEAKRQRIEC